MGDVAYVSKVSVVRKKGPMREAQLPAHDGPVAFGVHDEVAKHYGVSPDDFPPQTTTLDYVAATAAG